MVIFDEEIYTGGWAATISKTVDLPSASEMALYNKLEVNNIVKYIEYKDNKPFGKYIRWTVAGDKVADFEITKESVTLSLEGDVIQGDRFNIVVPFDNCNNFEELFTFHTVVNNPRIENLKNKEIEVIYKGVVPSKSMREIEEIKLKKSFPVDTEYNVYRDEKNKTLIQQIVNHQGNKHEMISILENYNKNL